MKILLAVDGSSYTKRMLGYLAAHDELISPGSEFTVLTVVSAVPPHVTGFIDHATLQKYYLDEAETVLKPVRAFAELNHWKPEFVYRVGYAPDVIASVAKEGHYDLVMMGSHGHSALASLVMGSVATRVMAHCPTPMLIVR